MIQEEWFNSTDVDTMLAFVAGRDAPAGAVLPLVPMSERKLRLFLVGCCRRHWHCFEDPECRQAIEVAEKFAEGEVSKHELIRQEQNTEDISERLREEMLASGVTSSNSIAKYLADIACGTCSSGMLLLQQHRPVGLSDDFLIAPLNRRFLTAWVMNRFIYLLERTQFSAAYPPQSESQRIYDTERKAQAHLLRCIAGNPFRLPNIDPSWFNSNVTSIADRIYSERDFVLLPILADALEEAGCNNPEMLQHCREPREHARGCWVVDWVLGKQ